MQLNRYRFWLLCVIFLIGFFLRTFQIGKSPYRGDEAFTVQYWVMQPISQTIRNQLTIDPQPLGAYLSYHYWAKLVGTSEVALRWLPSLVNALGTLFVYGLCIRLTQRNYSIGFVVALLWATHPFLIWHSQDVRNYALWSSASVLSLWMGVRAYQHSHWSNWLLFVLSGTLSSYLYYLDMFILVSFFVAMGWIHRQHLQTLLMAFVAYVCLGLLLAPWYLQPRLLSGGGYGGTTTGFQFSKLLTYFPNVLSFGFLPAELSPVAVGLFVVLVGLCSVLVVLHKQSKVISFSVLLVLIPLILLSLVSFKLNVWEPRYVLGIVPALLILVGTFFVVCFSSRRFSLVLLGFVFSFVWLCIVFFSLFYFYSDYTKSPDWRSLARYLAVQTTPNDYVIQTAADAAFGYYYHVVEETVAAETALPAEPDQPIGEIEQALSQIAQDHERVWIVAQGFTDWANYGVVEDWMNHHLIKVIDSHVNGLRVQQFRTMPMQLTHPIEEPVAFENYVTLEGYEVILPPQPTEEVYVLLEWQALQTIPSDYKTFIHLVDATTTLEGNPIWRQDDRFAISSSDGNSTIHVVYRLDQMFDLPIGEYKLLTGWYDAINGTRWHISDTETTYHVGTITVSETESSMVFKLD